MDSGGNDVTVCRFDPGRVELIGLSRDMPIYASTYDIASLPDFDGVIGQDFLSRFDINIDHTLGVIILTDRSTDK
jgi:hypothetical protein